MSGMQKWEYFAHAPHHRLPDRRLEFMEFGQTCRRKRPCKARIRNHEHLVHVSRNNRWRRRYPLITASSEFQMRWIKFLFEAPVHQYIYVRQYGCQFRIRFYFLVSISCVAPDILSRFCFYSPDDRQKCFRIIKRIAPGESHSVEQRVRVYSPHLEFRGSSNQRIIKLK